MALFFGGVLLAAVAVIGSGLGRHVVEPTAPDAREWPSIAVLAFRSQRSDPEGDALARDVASELASELARDAELRVISSRSSFQFAGTQTPLLEIAQRLRSRYIVDGTVRHRKDFPERLEGALMPPGAFCELFSVS
jgi:TolB-like protein